jgi:hypothetical protein
VDIAQNEMTLRVLEIRPIHFLFLSVDVICQSDSPPLTLKAYPHQTNARKKLGECFL